MTEIKEEKLSPALSEELIALSRDWECEDSCRGYRENTEADILGRKVFTAREDGRLTGYLFGELQTAEERSSVMESALPAAEVPYTESVHTARAASAFFRITYFCAQFSRPFVSKTCSP